MTHEVEATSEERRGPPAPAARPRSPAHRRGSARDVDEGERPFVALADQASAPLFVLSVIGSVLAIGTVHTTTLLVIGAFAFGALACSLYARGAEPGVARQLAAVPVITCAALALYCLMQAAPMPLSWLRAIAPVNADVWERSLLPFGGAVPRWGSLSLDPGASAVEALKWGVYAATFATAAIFSARRGAAWGVGVVFTGAAAAALTTVMHGLLSMPRVFGLYQPQFAVAAWHVGPLLNPNNLAGYLNLGALAGLGMLLSRKPIIPRWFLGVGVALIVGVEITSASRGGVVALLGGVLALASLARRRERGESGRSRRRAATLLLLAVVGGGAALAVLGGTSAMWAELYEKNLSKLEMALWARPLVGDHPFFGIGRGAFESVFPLYRSTPGYAVYTHAENFVVQWAAEWGLPVTIAAVIAFGWSFWPTRMAVPKSSLATGAWLGVLVLALQNLFDLAFEVPGVCIAAVAVMGSLWGDGRRHRLPRAALGAAEAPAIVRRIDPAAAVAVLGALLIGLAVPFRSADVASERSRIKAAYEGKSFRYPEETQALRGVLWAAMKRHPAEPYFPLIGALVAFRAHDQSPIPWIQRTLERGQVNGRAHLLLAEILFAARAKGQALFELRLSVESEPGLAGPAAKLALRWTRAYDELIRAVPEGRAGAKMLDQIASSLDAEDWALSSRVNREALARDPGEVGPRIREAKARLDALSADPVDKAVCPDREACRRAVLDHTAELALAEPSSSIAAQLRARLLVIDGKPDEALSMLKTECERKVDRVDCLKARVAIAAKIANPQGLDAASKELAGAGCSTNTSCADTAMWLGDIRMQRGEVGAAMAMYERAARQDPSEVRWLKVAEAAGRAGAHARALDALEWVARRRGGADTALQQRIEHEREQVVGGILQP